MPVRVSFTDCRRKEWEYACKAGTKLPTVWHDSKELSNYSWHVRNSLFQHQKIGQKSPNPFGSMICMETLGNGCSINMRPAKEISKKVRVNPSRAQYSVTSCRQGRIIGRWSIESPSAPEWDPRRHEEARPANSQERAVSHRCHLRWFPYRDPVRFWIEEVEKFWPSEEDIKAIPQR